MPVFVALPNLFVEVGFPLGTLLLVGVVVFHRSLRRSHRQACARFLEETRFHGGLLQRELLQLLLGGGGLLSGSALAVRALSPRCKIYGVEPEAGNDGQQSFRSGKIVHIDTPKTIADGAQTQHLGAYPFEIIRRDVDDILTVTDPDLIDAMRFFATRMKLLVEPTGCLSLAGARSMKAQLKGLRVGVIISGGNVDLNRFCALLGD